MLEDGEIFAIMDEMVAEGLTAHWGASVETLAEARICMAQPGCASLQIIFNLYRQNAAWEIFEEAKAKGVGIIVRLPLASGVLTGKFAKGQSFPESDHRNYNADGAAFSVGETFSGIEMDKGVDALDLIRPLVPEGMSLADFALRWILDHDAVSSVIAGVSRPDQAVRNAAVSRISRRWARRCTRSSGGSTRPRSSRWCAARSDAAGGPCVPVCPRIWRRDASWPRMRRTFIAKRAESGESRSSSGDSDCSSRQNDSRRNRRNRGRIEDPFENKGPRPYMDSRRGPDPEVAGCQRLFSGPKRFERRFFVL